ncbi:hypothetical protein [Microlunatus antarcticus]|uniref:Putative membrane protein n=1 Tax=Microlunatus antarcticus TaxID=53388 RepID=A0A7W5JUM9_9ACTN|nr:hypothetical protein [Microlunatus antarcticus]MBB3326578.1 putative membrane protein [Microlunatus antarcticus]
MWSTFPRGAAAEVALALVAGLVVVVTAHPLPAPRADQVDDWHSWLGLAAVLGFCHGLVRLAGWLRRRSAGGA